jgi:hypothetical protein
MLGLMPIDYIMPRSHTCPGGRCQGNALATEQAGAICYREGLSRPIPAMASSRPVPELHDNTCQRDKDRHLLSLEL